MKNYRAKKGPFAEQPYYETQEIEDLCADELRRANLFPGKPEPIRIERFIEKRFGISPDYADLDDGVLGFTRFGPKGVESIVVARTLSEDGAKSSSRRLNTTLAHEAGHGLLHAHLFVLKEQAASLFGAEYDPKSPRILCRDDAVATERRSPGYDGRWWEFQANKTIGAFLLPQKLFWLSLEPLLKETGSLGMKMIRPQDRAKAANRLSEVFDVNPAVAKIRLDQLSPQTEAGQLTL